MPGQTFPFRLDKAAQAAAVLLDSERSRRMESNRLLKLLYLADREHLKATGRPIVGGRLVAMDKGPVHSAVYDLIKKQHPMDAFLERVDKVAAEAAEEEGCGEEVVIFSRGPDGVVHYSPEAEAELTDHASGGSSTSSGRATHQPRRPS